MAKSGVTRNGFNYKTSPSPSFSFLLHFVAQSLDTRSKFPLRPSLRLAVGPPIDTCRVVWDGAWRSAEECSADLGCLVHWGREELIPRQFPSSKSLRASLVLMAIVQSNCLLIVEANDEHIDMTKGTNAKPTQSRSVTRQARSCETAGSPARHSALFPDH